MVTRRSSCVPPSCFAIWRSHVRMGACGVCWRDSAASTRQVADFTLSEVAYELKDSLLVLSNAVG
jgi:hypothetical protein